MQVSVLFFGRLSEVAGARHLGLDVAEGSTPASIFAEVDRDHPGLLASRARIRCAVDQEYAEWDAHLHDGAEVAFIPPTSGG